MKKLKLFAAALSLVALGAAAAHAITFQEPGITAGITTDPVIGGVSFWAGDPTVLNDTIVDDAITPGNNYLLNGKADGTGMSPAIGYDTFIGVSAPAGQKFGTISLDIASDYNFPDPQANTILLIQGLLGGSLVEFTSLAVSDTNYHALSLNFASGADTLYISDNLNSFGLSEPFYIDNFEYTRFDGGGGLEQVPEPSTLLLLGAGLAGAAHWRRRKSG